MDFVGIFRDIFFRFWLLKKMFVFIGQLFNRLIDDKQIAQSQEMVSPISHLRRKKICEL